MDFDDWKSYLPSYRFPSFLRTCFACLGVLILGSSLLLFLVLPSIFTYINTLDEAPIVDISVGSFLQLDGYRLEILALENDTRCPGETLCSPPGSATVRLRDTLSESKYVIHYNEASSFSDLVSLPKGYVIRVVNILPDSVSDAYTLRLQIFQPAKE